MERRVVLVTGAEGYVGRLLVEALAADPGLEVVATDVRASSRPIPGVTHERVDVTDAEVVSVAIAAHRPDTVVHLAAVVTPSPGQSREAQRRVDVDGTRHVLEACVASGVRKLIVTSSGAAYGYHPDNPPLLTEADPLRGNEVFAYAWHKRLVEELLAGYRESHPGLAQLVFRVSTILGDRVDNQITALFERSVVIGVAGADSPFCFALDTDVVGCLAAGVRRPEAAGIYNLTGAGVLTLREIAHAMGRRYLPVPRRWLARGLQELSARGLVPYGPEQVLFLAHRPVLSNEALVRDFGYRLASSREAFAAYLRSRQGGLSRAA